ncbi:head decoration protein [Lysobacter sp. LF1]|uniref:Head decoration protein n=1 Tax=Lysobacter stagni TaxID=3045172 RepID=A0ABT6XKQ6_9GAMM|nr:head decoration protein [Lysobacter sp. LF1]MDI9240744.1 head decoration protein [Lysobacter sp. LF1]
MNNETRSRAGFETVGDFTPDALIAGDFPLRTRKVLLAAGRAYDRGEVLGLKADGEYALSAAEASDGSEAPSVVLAESVDATPGIREAVVYLTGDFNAARLIYGAGHTAKTVAKPLRDLSIFLHTPVQA